MKRSIPAVPDDATHFQIDAVYAKWYKQVDGVWFYWSELWESVPGHWVKSGDRADRISKLVLR